MTIPALQVDGPLNRKSPLAVGLDLTSALGRVVGNMLTGLFKERGLLDGTRFDAVSNRIVELLCMLGRREHLPHRHGGPLRP